MKKFILCFFLISCASYHPRGQVIKTIDQFHALMRIESHLVQVGDTYSLTRQECKFFPRGLFQCQTVIVGKVKVVRILTKDVAEISTNTSCRPGDDLIPF